MDSQCTWLTLKLLKKRLVVRANVSVHPILDIENETEVVMRTLLVLRESI